jgi:hypothetical protein
MSTELTKHNNLGSFEEIDYVIDTLNLSPVSQSNLDIHCLSNADFFRIPISGIVALIKTIGYVSIENEKLMLNEKGRFYIGSGDRKHTLVYDILLLIRNNDFFSDFFSNNILFDSILKTYVIKKSSISLDYSGLRNLLLKLDFFRESENPAFYSIDSHLLNDTFEVLRAINKKKSLIDLKKDLENKEELGLQAEEFVISYERLRLNKDEKEIIHISEINAGAGYDIISFNDDKSSSHDRFIEVKSYEGNPSFYISSNEFKTSERLGEKYYLYLINRKKIGDVSYTPLIFKNPAKTILKNSDWKATPTNWFYQKK